MGFISQIIKAINNYGYALVSASVKPEKIGREIRDRKHGIDEFSICYQNYWCRNQMVWFWFWLQDLAIDYLAVADLKTEDLSLIRTQYMVL